nr:U-box domain-containing protein 33 [Ipomoea batatas]GME17173.1 U-box domain-containing protein 33 [Ipomoea batatas]
MATPPRVSDETVCIAVGKDVKESKYTIDWALQNPVGRSLCILHVHTPARKIPMLLGGNFGISLTNEYEAQVKVLCVEKDNIEKGIVDVISEYGIKKLVMGAAACRYYSREMTEVKSKKAMHVCKQAPPFCQIWFICKGDHIYTRLNVVVASPPLGSSRYASEGQTNQADTIGALPELESVQSVNITINLPGPRSASRKGLMSSPSSSSSEESTYEWYETPMGSFSLGSHHSSKSSGHMASDSYSVALCDHCQISPPRTAADAPESINAEEVLARSKEEIEQIRREFNMMVQKFEQNMVSNVELLLKYKKERDDLEVKLDTALRAAEGMGKKLDKEASTSSSSCSAKFYAEFSWSEIKEATSNFDPSLKIGNGGYGSVYRGMLCHTPVAIKILNPESIQGSSEFQQEVNILSKVRHPNLVTLIGACPETLTLVYEYLPNGSLDDHINSQGNTPPLPWQTRIRIASELRAALIFLHSWNGHGLVHGDLKPANVLLGPNFATKLSDFGICRVLSEEELSDDKFTRRCITDPKGTIVYMDPVFFATRELTPKSDVYSFGIILLRLLTGKPALGIIKLVQCGLLDKGKFKDLLDPSAGKWPVVQAEQIARLALRCCEMNRKERPELDSQVWKVLDG